MKILVINYDELNICPSKNEVIDDICRLYNDASKDLKEEMGHALSKQLDALLSAHTDENCDIIFADTADRIKRGQLGNLVSNYCPDLLVSYNLAGFELGTLADSLLYNLFDCRQFHIIKKKNLPNSDRLHILRSMNLFIFEDYKD